MSRTLADDFQSIPAILSAVFEWQICLDLVADSSLMTSSHLLAAANDRLPKLPVLVKAYVALQ